MPRRKLPAHISECLQLAIEVELNRFLQSTEEEFSFPSTLSKQDRAYIHSYAMKKGLTSKSKGKAQRVLTVYKPKKNVIRKNKRIFDITDSSKDAIYTLLNFLPVSQVEIDEVKMEKSGGAVSRSQFTMGTLTHGYLTVPPPPRGNLVRQMRRQLPIFPMRSQILEQVRKSQTIVIVSETGSGKTTQVPQYLLEHATEMGRHCKIVCTQPRRLAALSVADRVAYERGEQLGSTVGYQIRLESKTSPTSNLIYCTNGILVRCLMGGHYQKVFTHITHVIIDEVHERDKHSDFLLISLKEALAVNPHLKVILMSATIDSQLFAQYFNDCPVINIPGRTYEVTDYYLEHVLMMTEYCKTRMDSVRPRQKGTTTYKEQEALDCETVKLINECLEMCWTHCDDESFQQFLYLVAGENVPVDFRHTETDMTALMISAGRGMDEFVRVLLQMGANPNITSHHGMKAIDWARRMDHHGCVALLESAAHTASGDNDQVSDDYTNELLEVYQQSISVFEEEVDHKLLFALISKIHHEKEPGSILVFLPGYESILRQNEMILDAVNRGEMQRNLRIYMLHSNMKINDQKSVFQRIPAGYRKIILSTNIAETSITIDDVVYVIDCGKVKQTTFDALCGTTSLETTWVSQACAKQRAGRAGRVTQGICFRLYSLARYSIMDKFTIPELLRVPLTEICLSAKLISPQSGIAEYLEKALQPPTAVSVGRSVDLLKTMGALDEEENITELGIHLADLPVDAHLGKMVIYSILMKCVDPVLTIVSALSVRDPFTLPGGAKERGKVYAVKEKYAEKSFSDHMILIRIFQKWLDTPTRDKRQFCDENYLSSGAMQTICGVRTQILGHLRANGLIKSKGKGNIHDLNQNSKHWTVVKACLVAGLYPNVAIRDAKTAPGLPGAVLRAENLEKVLPHPHSILGSKKPSESKIRVKSFPTDWVAFEEKVRVGSSSFIRCNTIVTPATVALFAGAIHISEEKNLQPIEVLDSDSELDSDNEVETNEMIFHIDNNIEFTLLDETAYLLFHLRQKLNYLLLLLVKKSDSFHLTTNGPDGQVIEAITEVLLAEEKQYKFPIPDGIGNRPQAVTLDFSADVNYGIHEETPSSTMQWSLSDAMKDLNLSAVKAETQKKLKGQKKSSRKHALPKETKYYLIKATCIEQVNWTKDGFEWCFAPHIYNNLKQFLKRSPDSEVFLIFHVGTARRFYCMGQFVLKSNGKYLVDMIHCGSANFRTVREMVRHKAASFNWNDGEELSQELGEMFASLLSQPEEDTPTN